MTDRPITIKGAAGSLAQRVLYACLILLGLPLLVHTLFLYRQEYQSNVHDAFESLGYLASGRELYLSQMIQYQRNLVSALADDVPQDDSNRREAFLAEQAKDYKVHRFLYIGWVDGEPQCQGLACCPCLKIAGKQPRFAFVDPNTEKKNVYVGIPFPNPSDPAFLLMIVTPTEEVLDSLSRLGDSGYPIRLSLLDDTGWIFLSTEPGLEGTQFAKSGDSFSWKPYKDLQNAWFFHTLKETYLAVKIPLEGTDYILMLDVPESSINDLQRKAMLFRIGTFLAITALIGGVLLVWMTRLFARPLRSLAACMQRVADGGVHARFQPDRMGFEINLLGLQLNGMLDALLKHQETAEKERIIRERLAEELRIGHQIQKAMLPTDLPEVPTLDVAAGYLPAREVSGDFYDFFVLDDGRVLISIADAADKGISACLYAISFRSMLRTAAASGSDLASIIRTANRLLMRDTAASSLFITAWIGLYHPATRELLYSSHGHPPAYLCKRQGGLQQLPAGGLALGLEETASAIERLHLEEGDLVVLYTDGVVEAQNPEKHLYGEERLEIALRRRREASAEQLVNALIEDVRSYCSGAPQADDLTTIAFGVRNR